MDNYSLEEVKNLLNKNLITPEVFKNILNSTTRRLELYGDLDDFKILQYLSNSNIVPEEAKEEINKYLALYDSYTIKTREDSIESQVVRKKSMILVFTLIISLIILGLLLLFYRG